MTVNLNATPNSLKLTGDTHLSHHFGGIQYVVPRPLGVHPHINVRFANSVQLELSPEVAVELQRQLLLALADFPNLPDVHDAVVGGDE